MLLRPRPVMCLTSARRSRRSRYWRSGCSAAVSSVGWMAVDEYMPLWSCTDGCGFASAGCVRAVHNQRSGRLEPLDEADDICSGGRLVGLVGIGGCLTDNWRTKFAARVFECGVLDRGWRLGFGVMVSGG